MMWYLQNLKESFLELIQFRRHAQPFINSGLTPLFCYPLSLFIGLVVFFTCLFGHDYYYRSPKKKAKLDNGFGKFRD
jgi:hypothetical protein